MTTIRGAGPLVFGSSSPDCDEIGPFSSWRFAKLGFVSLNGTNVIGSDYSGKTVRLNVNVRSSCLKPIKAMGDSTAASFTNTNDCAAAFSSGTSSLLDFTYNFLSALLKLKL